jgi:predicted transposase YdaD
MAQTADIGSKRLISLAPDAWLQWVTGLPQITSLEFLSADFQWISREGDVLQKAFLPELGEFLVLTELQLRFDRRMPQRMRLYAALAEERYGLLTYPVLVNILPPPRNASTQNFYQSELLGLQARQDYRVINLWEIDADLILQQPLPTLLPFVPILQGGNQPAKVARAVQLLRNQDQLRDLEPLLAFFAGFVLETQIIQEIMRWDMEILRESPWYNQMIQEGLQQGLQQGRGSDE